MAFESSQIRPQIVTPHGHLLTWTDDDRLWLLRAVEAEGEPRALVAQTLVNRWAWLMDSSLRAKYPTLTSLVRAYAQPVNPAWFPEGKLFQESLLKMPEHQRAAATKRAVYRRDVASTRTTFTQPTIDAVRGALFGPVVIPVGALHFAAPSLLRADLPVLVASTDPSQNTIYGERDPLSSRARYALTSLTTMDGPNALFPDTGNGQAIAIVALVSVGLGLALYWSRTA